MKEPIVVSLAKEVGATRYNGGWIKTVSGLDKSKSNGFSILGEFVGEGLQPLQPGLFLINDVGGSRKNQTKHYYLVVLHDDGSVETLEEVTGTSGYNKRRSEGADWAVKLWPAIDAHFAAQAIPSPVERLTQPDLIQHIVSLGFRDPDGKALESCEAFQRLVSLANEKAELADRFYAQVQQLEQRPSSGD